MPIDPSDNIEYDGPSQRYIPTIGNLRDSSTTANDQLSIDTYANLGALKGLLDLIDQETSETIIRAEKQLGLYNLSTSVDERLAGYQETEWPEDQLGPVKDYVSYDQYKALERFDTVGSTYIRKMYTDKIRGPAGTSALDIINVASSIKQEALHVKDFVDDAIGSVSDTAEYRALELLQDWAHDALTDARSFRSWLDSQGSNLQQIPASEMDSLTPDAAKRYQAVFQVKLNIINQNIETLDKDLDKQTGYLSETFFKRFFAPALKIKLQATNDLDQHSVIAGSFFTAQAQQAVKGLTMDYVSALTDQLNRNTMYRSKIDEFKDRLAARDSYVGFMRQLVNKGAPIPNPWLDMQIPGTEKDAWSNAVPTVPMTATPTQGPPGRDGAPGHDGKDGKDGKDATPGHSFAIWDEGVHVITNPDIIDFIGDGVIAAAATPGHVTITISGGEGSEGPEGPEGPQGPQGPQGDPGADGADGADGNIFDVLDEGGLVLSNPEALDFVGADITVTEDPTGTAKITISSGGATGVAAGSYGSASSVGTFTVATDGRLSAAANVSITIAESQVTNLISDLAAKLDATAAAGGDLTGNYPNPTLVAIGSALGPIGDATHVPSVTIDAKGRVTGLTSVAITGTPPGGSAGGDLTGTYPNPTLVTSGVTAGTYGGPFGPYTLIAQQVVDAKGRITSATNSVIPGVLSTGMVISDTLVDVGDRTIPPFMYGTVDTTGARFPLFSVGEFGGVYTRVPWEAYGRVFTGTADAGGATVALAAQSVPATDIVLATRSSDNATNITSTTWATAGTIDYNGDTTDWPTSGRFVIQTNEGNALIRYDDITVSGTEVVGGDTVEFGTFTGCRWIGGLGKTLLTSGTIHSIGDAIASGTRLGQMQLEGWWDEGFHVGAEMRAESTQGFTDTAAGTKWIFAHTETDSIGLMDKLVISTEGIQIAPVSRTYTIDEPFMLFGGGIDTILTSNDSGTALFPAFIQNTVQYVADGNMPNGAFVAFNNRATIQGNGYNLGNPFADPPIWGWGFLDNPTLDATSTSGIGVYASFHAAPTVHNDMTVGVLIGYNSLPTAAFGGGVSFMHHFQAQDALTIAGVSEQIGLEIGSAVSPLNAAATNIGVRIHAPNGSGTNYAIHLPTDTGTAAQGITFGTTGAVVLWKSANNKLKTSDTFIVGTDVQILSGGVGTTLHSLAAGAAQTLNLPDITGTDTLAVRSIDNAFTAAQTIALAAGAANLTIKSTSTPTGLQPVGGDINFSAISTVTTEVIGAQFHAYCAEPGGWDATHQGTGLQIIVAQTGVGGLAVAQQIGMDLSTAFGGDLFLLNKDINLGTVIGTKIGTGSTQKLCFYGGGTSGVPITQPNATTDLGTVLANLGLRASGTAYPITTSGDVTLSGTTLQTDGTTALFGLRRTSTPGLLGILGKLTFSAYDTGTNPVTGAIVQAVSVEPSGWSSGVAGTSLVIQTTAVGGATAANCATFGADKSFSPAGDLNIAAGKNIVLTTTGSQIGTGPTQKIGFFGASVVAQQGATIDLGVALSNLGLRASGTAYPITTSGDATFSGTTKISNGSFAHTITSAAAGSDKILTIPNLTDTVAVVATDNAFTAAQTIALAAGAANLTIKSTSTPTALQPVGGDLNFQAFTGSTAVTGFQIHAFAGENWDSTHQGTGAQILVAKTGVGGLGIVQQLGMDLSTTFGGTVRYTQTTLTYASPTSVDPKLGNCFKVTTVNATGSVTFNLATVPLSGVVLTFIIVNDATSGKTITFGTNFKSTGTLVGTTSQTRTIVFVSDGTNAWEVSRTAAMA